MTTFIASLLLTLSPLAHAGGDAPEISRSVGEPGGVVLFWPRVVPKTQDPSIRALAGALQDRLKTITESAAPGRPIDVRPEPERVCPRAGCKAMTVGVLLYHQGEACLAVALVSGKGKAETRMAPWVGEVVLQQPTVPFREPPESSLAVKDWARCSEVLAGLEEEKPAVETLIGEVHNLR